MVGVCGKVMSWVKARGKTSLQLLAASGGVRWRGSASKRAVLTQRPADTKDLPIL